MTKAIQDVFGITETYASSAEELSASAEQLGAQAESLRQAASGFKVSLRLGRQEAAELGPGADPRPTLPWSPPPPVGLPAMNQDLLPDNLFAKCRVLNYPDTVIRTPETGRVMRSHRIRRRVQATGASGFADYFTRLSAGGDRDEFSAYIDAVTTRESYFFRNAQHFQWLAEGLAPALVKQARAG
ncbi:hypothetical protein [Tautonia sociabilis]|uniref:hypothetical protein n=1 Tax=Tautonia sociabilis TaxID=2080755 RepID=UPI001F3BEAEA|nr:hypothetical protein [Tautonia sociabilis]